MTNTYLEKLRRPALKHLNAYKVQPSSGYIKLDAMENPYTLPDDVKKEWAELLLKTDFNRYPDPNASALKQSIRRVLNVPDSCDMMLGNGSDELIQIIAMALAGKDEDGSRRVILSPDPGFAVYNMVAAFTGSEYVGVPLDEDFSLNQAAMLRAIAEHNPAVIFLARPNNPTGNVFEKKLVDEIIEKTNGLVVIDEAYHAFCGKSYLGDIRSHDNVIVMRTLSKLGFAGLRLGMLFGAKDWLQEFEKIRLPYNINILTQVTAEFCLRHYDVFERQVEILKAERTRLLDVLSNRSDVRVYSSEANFLFFKTLNHSADDLFERLKQEGLLVKNLHKAGSLTENCLRLTVSSPEENGLFLQSFDKVMRKL